jgi:AsmA protein
LITLLRGDLAFKSLNLADLGPVVGAEAVSPARRTGFRGRTVAERNASPGSRALPALPFRRDRWTTIDADVHLTAQTILRPEALPLEHLTARLRMRESILTLDPMDFGVAGGHLDGVIRLDGQQNPIQAHAKMGVRKLLLGKLLPTIALAQNSIGQINGEIELIGRGDSIARMLATADGKVGLVIEGGKISKLLMEQVAMHVPEMLLQQITGDQLIDIRCGVADFNVEHGVMQIGALVLDTDVTRIAGTGSVDLAKETLSLTLVPSPKRLSLFALRGPISVRGDLAHPDLAVDAGRVGVRGLAAIVLAAINPVLSVIALADPGSGEVGDCNALAKQAQAPWHKTASAEKHAPGLRVARSAAGCSEARCRVVN